MSNERVIKFRAFDKNGDGMFYNIQNGITFDDGSKYTFDRFLNPDSLDKHDWIVMQFTGLHDKNGVEIYEGDVFRVEEDGAEDESDQIYYLVVVWVKEWCMFCTLRVVDEYWNYTHGTIKQLDEPMFWTYTLEDTNDRRFYLCGNIYQNPELLKR